MGTFSIWHWLIVLAVVLLLFGGGGKIPKLMKDVGSGINAFKRGLKDEEKDTASGDKEEPKALEAASGETAHQETARTETARAESQGQGEDRKAANG